MPRVRTVTVSYGYMEIRLHDDGPAPRSPAPVRIISASPLRTVVALVVLAGAGTLARRAWRASLGEAGPRLTAGPRSRLGAGRRALPPGRAPQGSG